MIPAGSPDGGPAPVIFDGAKRDRLVWVGDIAQDVPTIADSLGSNGAPYVTGSLAIFGAKPPDRLFGAPPAPPGEIGGLGFPTGNTYRYSVSYSMYFVFDIASYFEHSGDLGFVRKEWPAIQGELAFNASYVDPATGLLTVDASGGPDGLDWDLYDGIKTGAVTEFNAIYYHDLVVGAEMARAARRQRQADCYTNGRRRCAKPSTRTCTTRPRACTTSARTCAAGSPRTGMPPPCSMGSPTPAARGRSCPSSSNSGSRRARSRSHPTLATPAWSARSSTASTCRPASPPATRATRMTSCDRVWGQMVMPGRPVHGRLLGELHPVGGRLQRVDQPRAWLVERPTSALSEYTLGIRPRTPGYGSWIVAPQPGICAGPRGRCRLRAAQ